MPDLRAQSDEHRSELGRSGASVGSSKSGQAGNVRSIGCLGLCNSAIFSSEAFFGGASIASRASAAGPRPLFVSPFIGDQARQWLEFEMSEFA